MFVSAAVFTLRLAVLRPRRSDEAQLTETQCSKWSEFDRPPKVPNIVPRPGDSHAKSRARRANLSTGRN